MNFDTQLFKLIKNTQIGENIFDFVVQNDNMAVTPVAGQFAHIAINGKILRRPISICDATKNTMRLVFEIKGEGTKILANTKEGDSLDILTPLGKGFQIDKNKKYAFIGGGIGVPPMLYTAKQVESSIAIIGFRDKNHVILEDDFIKANCKTLVSTDDGSYGLHGFVTDNLKDVINEIDEVCACGPNAMLKSIYKMCKSVNIPCQVSLEERMGCGVGACLVCACKVLVDGKETYRHVCKDGPVFKGEEVFF